MARASIQYRCIECGYKSVKELGRCPNCGAWDSFKEETPPPKPDAAPGKAGLSRPLPNLAALTRLADVSEGGEVRFSSRMGELDRVLGGGFVPGEVLLSLIHISEPTRH